MSFLNFDLTALPKSCQSAIRRAGHCTCRSCIGVSTPASSSSSSGRSKNSLNNLWSSIWSSGSSKTSSHTSIDKGGDSVLDPSEPHLLAILSGIDKSRLERDLFEVSDINSLESINNCGRKEKRKAGCSSDDSDEMTMEDAMTVLREAQHVVRVVVERKKLVPSSQLQKQREWMEREKRLKNAEDPRKSVRLGVKNSLEKRWREMGESGKRKFRKAVGKKF